MVSIRVWNFDRQRKTKPISMQDKDLVHANSDPYRNLDKYATEHSLRSLDYNHQKWC